MRRLAALLLALSALIGVSVSAPQPAAADGGIVSSGVKLWCDVTRSAFFGIIPDGKKGNPDAAGYCRVLGDVAQIQAKKEWKAIQDSLIGDVIASGVDAAKWLIKTVATTALGGPSLDLNATGLWAPRNSSDPPSIAGMLVWLGLIIATLGVMWQLGKMAVTGQTKHLGRAMRGWVEQLVLSFVGVAFFIEMLAAGDAISDALVNATFTDEDAYGRIMAVMVPAGVANPVLVSGMVGLLLLVGFVQLATAFLRMSAIPLICLLLPVAGAGRVGGDATRQWAPKLITAGMVIVALKPMVAVIVCTGFAEVGDSTTLAEWLRGFVTLFLAAIAPGPLTKIFAPFGAAVGGGLGSGGAMGAIGAAAGFFGRTGSSGGAGPAPTTAVDHARFIDGFRGGNEGPPPSPSPSPPPPPDNDDDDDGPNLNRIPPSHPAPHVPGPDGTGGEADPTVTIPSQTGGSTPPAVPVTNGTGSGAPGAAGMAALGIEIIDGVNDVIQRASSEAGGGNQL